MTVRPELVEGLYFLEKEGASTGSWRTERAGRSHLAQHLHASARIQYSRRARRGRKANLHDASSARQSKYVDVGRA